MSSTSPIDAANDDAAIDDDPIDDDPIDDAPIDETAIFTRLALRWPSIVLYLAGIALLGVGQTDALEPTRTLDKIARLTLTTQISRDPAVIQAAQQQMAVVERTWIYRGRHLARWAPWGIGLALIVGAATPWLGARRRVAWARDGRCIGCGYDLRGSSRSSRCPECDAPPAPRKVTGASAPRFDRRRLLGFVPVAGFVIYLAATSGLGSMIAEMRGEGRIEDAYHAARPAQFRYARVLDAGGTRQFCFVRDAGGFVRKEQWLNGAVEQASVSPVDGGIERFRPGTGVTREQASAERASDESAFEPFDELLVKVMADAPWSSSQLIPTAGPYEVHRAVRRAGLHDHHARRIDITVIDAVSRRPRFKWEATFAEVLDPRAVPPINDLSVVEITYPEAVDPALRRLDPESPGRLRAEFPVFPAWLDRAWAHPVIEE